MRSISVADGSALEYTYAVRTKTRAVSRSQYPINLSEEERRRLEFLAEHEAKAKGLRTNQVSGAEIIRGLLIERSIALGFKGAESESTVVGPA